MSLISQRTPEMQPTVSVVIPTFNSEATIARAIDSVLLQRFGALEVIVVDDGSTDGTIRRLQQFGEDRIKIIKQPTNRGAAAARNAGIAVARGQWIAFLDSDDAWRPDKLAKQLAILERQPNAAAVCTGYYLHKENRTLEIPLDLGPQRFRKDIVFGCTISPGSTLIVAASAFERIGTFDEELQRLEDWDWLLRFSKQFDMAFVPEPLADIYTSPLFGKAAIARRDSIEAAIARLRSKHRSQFRSHAEWRRFLGSLYVEKAAALHRTGENLAATRNVVLALAIHPTRNVAFFRTLWRSGIGLITRRRQN